MTKVEREEIRNLFGGKCAYCGNTLQKLFHIDHVKPIFRGWKRKPKRAGEDTKDNMFPSCPQCNIRKRTHSLEEFRYELEKQIDRQRRDSSAFRLMESYNLIECKPRKIIFWFETYQEENIDLSKV